MGDWIRGSIGDLDNMGLSIRISGDEGQIRYKGQGAPIVTLLGGGAAAGAAIGYNVSGIGGAIVGAFVGLAIIAILLILF